MERTVPAVGELWGTPVTARRLIRILRALRPSFPVTGFGIPRVCVRAIGLCAIRAIITWLILSLALSFAGALATAFVAFLGLFAGVAGLLLAGEFTDGFLQLRRGRVDLVLEVPV